MDVLPTLRHAGWGRRSREARTGFMLPRSPSARDRGTRLGVEDDGAE